MSSTMTLLFLWFLAQFPEPVDVGSFCQHRRYDSSKKSSKDVNWSTRRFKMLWRRLQLCETRNDDSNKAIVRETRNDDSNVAMREATHPTFGHNQPPRKKIDHVHTRGGSPKSRSFLAFRGNLWLLFWMMIALIAIFRPF
ncbi:hypothetical protein JI435_020950 [Parastagonospora nodorum SN15]|uniref:Uncharacterized protein n=1 Tax=Phaeosphaeria nodorum (strain SN15 / ATCC MYA-4574 / FGSC 10173) TaxID=321614 RepID=A0A7U2HV78_PHANO|nr:hypothetical protein JI435_020950 [Parastagonospora nodorum SN15]